MHGVIRAGLLGVTLVVVSGCASGPASRERAPHVPDLPEDVAAPTDFVSLVPDSTLHDLAARLDSATIQRSAIVQEERAALALLAARGYDLYPQVRPAGGLDIGNGAAATIGPSLSQVLFDNGRSRADLSQAELDVGLAGLRAWIARNEGVYEGLRAYVDMSRYQARLRSYAAAEEELNALAQLLELRANGGISDRGELLRMNVARQEVQRDIVTDTAALRQAGTDLTRHLPQAGDIPPLRDLASASAQCRRDWPQIEPPRDALARLEVGTTRITADRTRAQRLPRLVLGASAAATTAASAVTPGVSLNIDTGDMLGMGARLRIEAAELESEAALATYEMQRQDTAAELARLDANHAEFIDGLRRLQRLQRTNRETLTLYREQIEAGTISLVDGIVLYREVMATEIAIIDMHADALINCLRVSQHRGVLAPFALELEPTVSTSND